LTKSKTTKSKKKSAKARWKFSVGDKAIYVGGLFEVYKNTEVMIIDRSRQHIKEYYKVRFIDGNEGTTIDTVLNKVEEEIS
jgi:hypothetical protein